MDAAAALLLEAGVPCEIHEDILYRQWSKLMLNVGLNPVSYTHLDVYKRQVLETLRSQIQETNHQLNQSSSAYSVLGRKMEEMELLFASSAYQRSHVFKCRRRKKRVVLRKGASE